MAADANFYRDLSLQIRQWGAELGFQQVGITDTNLEDHEARLAAWLDAGRQGEMQYMARHGTKRSRPAELIPGTRRVITARMNYLVEATERSTPERVLASDGQAYVSRYALGRDYHKVVRRRLVRLWDQIADQLEAHGETGYNGRVFTDSAPVLEKALAEKSGIGWIGKNTLLLSREAGSWFFLGEIYTSAPLERLEEPTRNHCGSCRACIDVCPTDAIVAPYELDARRCISYLTIEHGGTIPEHLRRPMGNRVFGCDDCQLVCPWNKYAQFTDEADFKPRHGLDQAALLALFAWTEQEFLDKTQGSPIRRAGYQGWLRNLAIAIGNGPFSAEAVAALEHRRAGAADMLAEHIDWAIKELKRKRRIGSATG